MPILESNYSISRFIEFIGENTPNIRISKFFAKIIYF